MSSCVRDEVTLDVLKLRPTPSRSNSKKVNTRQVFCLLFKSLIYWRCPGPHWLVVSLYLDHIKIDFPCIREHASTVRIEKLPPEGRTLSPIIWRLIYTRNLGLGLATSKCGFVRNNARHLFIFFVLLDNKVKNHNYNRRKPDIWSMLYMWTNVTIIMYKRPVSTPAHDLDSSNWTGGRLFRSRIHIFDSKNQLIV